MKCPETGKYCRYKKRIIKEMASKGGRMSKRTISKEQREAMEEAKRAKKERG